MPELDERRERMISVVLLLLFLVITGGAATFVYRQIHASDAQDAPQTSAPAPEAPAASSFQPPARHPSKLMPPKLLNLAQLRQNILKFYPREARRAGRQASVVLTLVVEADGSVGRADVKTSADADFDEAAKKVGLAMKFRPAFRGEEPVAVQIDETVDFSLGG